MPYNSERSLELLRLGTQNPKAMFHDGQEEAIRHVVEGRGRLLVVQRTGWGKSSVYFIATKLLREQSLGPAILISPLLALMRNQIGSAERMGVRAATIHDTYTAHQGVEHDGVPFHHFAHLRFLEQDRFEFLVLLQIAQQLRRIRLRPVRMRSERTLTLEDFRMTHLTSIRMMEKLWPTGRLMNEVHRRILGSMAAWARSTIRFRTT